MIVSLVHEFSRESVAGTSRKMRLRSPHVLNLLQGLLFITGLGAARRRFVLEVEDARAGEGGRGLNEAEKGVMFDAALPQMTARLPRRRLEAVRFVVILRNEIGSH